jgi:hypothetical protein
MFHLTLRVCLRLAIWPSAQFINLSKQRQPKMLKNDPQASGTGTDLLASQGRVLVRESPLGESRARKAIKKKFLQFASREKSGKNCTDKLRTRTAFQRFINKTPHSTFKKLIVSTPALLRGLHTMSLSKSVPEGLNPRKCKQTKLREPSPVP